MDHFNLWYEIFQELDFKYKLCLIFSTSHCKNSLHITNLFDIDKKYLMVLTNNILKWSIFEHVTDLYASSNKNITNVSFLSHLKMLDASYDSGLGQDGITGLNLIGFAANDNSKICDMSFMHNLKELYANYRCGIDQNGINIIC